MKNRTFSILALAAFVSLTACAKGDGDDVVEQDTTTIPGADTITGPIVVPTEDSVITTTTTDTIEGEASDTVTDTTAAHP